MFNRIALIILKLVIIISLVPYGSLGFNIKNSYLLGFI